MDRVGTVSFQSNDASDVFFVADVFENGVEPSDEAMLEVEDVQFDSEEAWVTGRIPQLHAVNIEGDTALIHAWFKGEQFDKSFMIKVYIEYELSEELLEVESEAEIQKDISDLAPQEIHL